MEKIKSSRRPNIIEAAMKYKQITLAITFLLMLAGGWALFTMPRMEDPYITIRQGIVYARYPGANELVVEEQLTKKLEQFLFSFKEVRKEKTYSYSKFGECGINIRLHDWVKDKDRFWATLQHGLNSFARTDLPVGVIGPFVNGDFGETVAIMITVSAPGKNYRDLEDYLDILEDGIKIIPQTSRIRRYGEQKEQLIISLDNERINNLGFDAQQIVQALQSNNILKYSGSVELNNGSKIAIDSKGLIDEVEKLNDLVVYTGSNGLQVKLKDVSTVQRDFEVETSFIKQHGQRAVMLAVEMQPGNNIVQFGKVLDDQINEIRKKLPNDVELVKVSNQPKVVEDKLGEFMKEFYIAIGSVILVVILLLPFRMAVISAIASPISILVTFAVINLLGYEIHQVTLAALIICLGMVVDDAIVVVDNYIEQLDHGLDRWTAAWKSATQLFIPIFTATATIIFSFLPLLFTLQGLPNEYVSQLPPSISIALACSFMVAIFLTPLLCFLFVKKGLRSKDSTQQRNGTIDKIQASFDKLVNYSFKYWPISISIAIASVVAGGFIGSQIPPEFLPIAERDQFNIEVHMREGTSVLETEQSVDRIVDVIEQDARVRDVVSFVGTSSPRFYSTYAPEAPRENYAQIFISTEGPKATVDIVKEYLDRFDDLVPDGKVRIRQLSFQEELAPIEVRVVGDKIEDLKKVGSQIETILTEHPATNFVRTDFGNDYFRTEIEYLAEEISRVGLTKDIIAQTIGYLFSGMPISKFWEGDRSLDIVVKLDSADRNEPTQISNIYVTNQNGQRIKATQVVTLSPIWGTGQIIRRNGLRTLTVRAEAQRGTVAAFIVKDLKPKIDALKLPSNVHIEYGGDDESTRENLPLLGKALFVSALLIFLTLLIQFKSIAKAVIILLSFPLSLFGAMLGLYLSGNHAGFTTFLGITSLIGIVVRNGIILVDYADELVEKEGYSVEEAAKASAKRRMRPIFLTSAAAAVGVMPMIFGGSPLWAPMGSILASGLMFSMLMTLFIIPILYARLIKPTTTHSQIIIGNQSSSNPIEQVATNTQVIL